jgi:hypothetical protein
MSDMSPFLPEDPVREKKLMDLMHRENDRAVRVALKSYSKKVAILFAAFAAAAAILFYIAFTDADEQRDDLRESGVAVAVEGCNRDFRGTEKIRSLLIRLQKNGIERYRQTEKAGPVTPEVTQQFNEAQDFYKDQLQEITLPDCRKTAAAFNVNPDRLEDPVPLYPSQSDQVRQDLNTDNETSGGG